MINLVGRHLGRYHIVEQLGRGGMAAVFKAFDGRLERNVAVKVILPQHTASDEFRQRFEREAKALAQMSHPNIVNVHDYGEQDGIHYIVMDFLPGGTLRDRMGRTMMYQEAARLLIPVARALAYAHQRKVIHRDIKPANILLTESGQPMLTDFGVAKMLESTKENITQAGVGIGTPEYMAPEQGMGRPVDERTDIYALGIVFYELVTGRRPFQADTPMAVVIKHAMDPLPRPRSFEPDLPEVVEQVLFKALAKKPEDRYQNMEEFAQALETLMHAQRSSSAVKKPAAFDGGATELKPVGGFQPLERPRSAADHHRPAQQQPLRPSGLPVYPPPYPPPARPVVMEQPRKGFFKRIPLWLWILSGLAAIVLCIVFGGSALLYSFGSELFAITPIHTLSLDEIDATLEATRATDLAAEQKTTSTPITATQTAEISELPGKEVIPIDQMQPYIPWLSSSGNSVPAIEYLGFNVSKAPFDDPRVRSAFSLAVDREALAAADGSDKKPATSFFPPDILGRDLTGEVGFSYDPNRARQLLAEAGYPDGDGFPEFMLGRSNASSVITMTDMIATMWEEELGVTPTMQQADSWDEYVAMLADDPPHIYRLGWYADYIDPHNFSYDIFLGESNYGGFYDATYQDLISEAEIKANEPQERQALYIEADRILCEEQVAVIPLYYYEKVFEDQ